VEQHGHGSVAGERSGGTRGAPLARVAIAGLVALALASLGASPGARRMPTRSAPQTTRTIVIVKSLDDGRHYASIVDRQRPALDRMDGTLRSGDTEARVAAFLESGQLRLIDERVSYGEGGGTGRNRYYVADGRLVFFDSVRVRPRDVGKDRLRARDEVLTTLAFGEDGQLVGGAKTVNREPVALPNTDPPGILARFQSLAGAVETGGSGQAQAQTPKR
jgi:hypothetical protein